MESSEILELCRNGESLGFAPIKMSPIFRVTLFCAKYAQGHDEHRALTNVTTKTAPNAPHTMRSPETTPHQDQKEKLRKPSGFNHAFLEAIRNPFGMFDQKVKLWSSKRYMEAALLNKDRLAEMRPSILNELKPDLKSFLDEYAALLPVVRYEYGTNGMKNGYTQSMTQIAQHHLQEQELKDMTTDRALMEVHVAKTIENWMSTPELPLGSKIISVSPRGSKNEGYPGLNKKNYIFVNVFEKVADGFIFQQYRSYDTLAQTFQLQSALEETLGGLRKYATAVPQPREDLHAIASLVTFGPEVPLSQIEPLIYANKESWAVNIDTDLPKLDWSTYTAISSKTVDFCVQQFIELTDNPELSPQDIERFTLLVTTVKESLIKWVETHALNYDSKEPDHEMDFDQLLAVWKARCASADGEKLNKEQSGLLNTFKNATALDASLPLKGLSSWAHCIVGSPASLMKLQNMDMMNAVRANQLSSTQLTELIGKERAALWHEGTCVRCGDGCMVGECSICMRCEMELGGQLPSTVLSTAESEFLDSLSGEEKNKGKALFKKFSKLILRETISFEQLINNDFINSSAPKNEELEPYLNRLFFAPNGLEELEKIVLELSTNNIEKEHNNSGKVFAMPIENSNSQSTVAAA